VALTELTNKIALDTAMEAARADSHGKLPVVVEQVCRLAVTAGVATGEVTWLVSELEAAGPDDAQRDEAAVAVSNMQSCMASVAFAVEEFALRGGPAQISSSAAALRRVGAQLEDVQARLQPCG